MAGSSQVPRGHHRQKTKLQETGRLRKTEDLQKDEFTKVLNSLSYFKQYLRLYNQHWSTEQLPSE